MQNLNTWRRIFFLFPNYDKVPTNLIPEKFDFILMQIFTEWTNRNEVSKRESFKRTNAVKSRNIR